MPQIKPLTVVTDSGNVTLNPIGKVGERVNYVEDINSPIYERQTFSVRVRPATVANTGHLTELQLAAPILEELPEGCCPTTASGPFQLPANTFNLRILRSKASNDDQIEKVLEELRALLDNPDIVSIIRGSGLY